MQPKQLLPLTEKSSCCALQKLTSAEDPTRYENCWHKTQDPMKTVPELSHMLQGTEKVRMRTF